MVLWEYKVEEVSDQQIENQLNFMGREGWELVSIKEVSVTSNETGIITAIFKRPLPSQGDASGGWFK